jgi:hypothetical protein
MSTLKVTNIQATGETATRAVSGVAAAWVNFNGTGTIAIRDSQNVSGLVDNGTGDYTINLSNSMANVNYAVPSGGGYAYGNSGANDTNVQCYDMTVSLFDLAVGYLDGAGAFKRDHSLNVATAHGDLA